MQKIIQIQGKGIVVKEFRITNRKNRIKIINII